MRCLYCDGKLPLYRKITHGQFCSTAHRKAYWQEQERLAVERLHQTHSSLKAYRASVPVESILGRDPGVEPAGLAPAGLESAGLEPAGLELGSAPRGAELIGFLTDALQPQSQGAPRILETDPFVFDLAQSPGKPAWTSAERPLTSIPSAGLVRPPQGWVIAIAGQHVANGRCAAIFPKSGATPALPSLVLPNLVLPSLNLPSLNLPSLEQDIASWAGDGPPASAGRVAMTVSAAPPSSHANLLQPLPWSVTQPAEHIGLSIPPVTPEMELPEEKPPQFADSLFSLPRFLALTAGMPGLTIEAEPLEPAPPVATLPEHQVTQTVGLSGLASIVPLTLAPLTLAPLTLTQALPPATTVAQDVCAIAAAAPEPSQAILALSQREPSLGMGRGSRYPIEIRAGRGHNADADPIDFPLVPAGVVLPAPRPPAELSSAASRLDEWVPDMRGLVALNVHFGPPTGSVAAPIVSNIATIPQPLRTEPILPSSRLEPLDAKPAADLLQPELPPAGAESPERTGYVWSRAAGFWKLAPRDLKLLAFAIPALLALAFHRELPKVRLAATPSTGELRKNLETVVSSQWTNLRQAVMDRAAVALDEDFRSGLDDWASRSDATAEWSFDATGFVRPGPLALYRPSMNLTDYQVQFLGLIDKKALSWVVRAADFDNYYVIKLVVLKPGPRTTIGLTRYAVIQGKAVDGVETVVPLEAQPDTLYRVRLELNGDEFSLGIQGQMIDSWSEPRLPRGGIGFFTAKGEESRIRWVALTHQYDMLGRLCAYLAPYETPTTNGSW